MKLPKGTVYWLCLTVWVLVLVIARAIDGRFDALFWADIVLAVLMLGTAYVSELGKRREAAADKRRSQRLVTALVGLRNDALLRAWDLQIAASSHQAVLETLSDDVRAALGFPVHKPGQGIVDVTVDYEADTVTVIRRPPASEALVPEGQPIPGWAKGYFQPEPPTRRSPTTGDRRG